MYMFIIYLNFFSVFSNIESFLLQCMQLFDVKGFQRLQLRPKLVTVPEGRLRVSPLLMFVLPSAQITRTERF